MVLGVVMSKTMLKELLSKLHSGRKGTAAQQEPPAQKVTAKQQRPTPPEPGLLVTGSIPKWIDKDQMDAVTGAEEYQELSVRCQDGDREAMLRFADWFESLSTDEKDDYMAASHFWRLRYCYVESPDEAQSFLEAWLSSHPGKECRVLVHPSLKGGYPGEVLRFAGIPGWEGYTQHHISGSGDKLLIVDELVRESRTDNDSDYRRYICDLNLKRIPGSKSFMRYDDEFDDEQEKEYQIELVRAEEMVK